MIADLPDDLARLWRVPKGSRLGRPAALDVDVVVRTAIELADRDGLPGATLPKLAAELGVTPMSLYRHVGSKDELLTLMGDLAFGPPPEYPPPHNDWRAMLRQWAHAQWAVHRRRPWLAHLPISGPPRGPHLLAWVDAGLRAVRDTGLDPAAKLGTLTVVSGYVRHADLLAQQLAEGWLADGTAQPRHEQTYGRQMSALIDPNRFPDAAALFASGLFESPPPTTDPTGDDFHFGLDLILDGVAVAIAR
ncbi:TetR/AcrR family transcriptional regulator [Nocardia sp. XZ_19_385]|uniref:TetR/AcrR family transcriptional regulator n=1 Tax=Nocardia sp. XZ_19_385 TaxID=2769488 RepID=UPI0028164DA1|nr:TetR/AcrR family transcriptional regulator [Nocardia sp. XZ_19_385]